MQNNAPDAELLSNISALSELGNTIEQAAKVLQMPVEDFVALLRDNAEARARWERGGIEAENELKICLTRQAKAGSVQAAAILLKMKGLDKPEKVAPVFSAATTPPTKSATAPSSQDWLPIPKAAACIVATAKAIRDRVNGKNPAWPKLESKEIKGENCVSACAAYDHFLRFGKRQPEGLRKPAWYDAPPAADNSATSAAVEALIDPDIIAALGGRNPFEMDGQELAQRLLLSGAVEPVKVRLALLAADSYQRRRAAEMKAAAMVSTPVVRKMIRAHADLIKEWADVRDKAWAEKLLRFIPATFPGIDIPSKRPDALALLACFYREDMNQMFEELEGMIKKQMNDVREIELRRADPALSQAPVIESGS